MTVQIEEGLHGETMVAAEVFIRRSIGVGCALVPSSSPSLIHQGIRRIAFVILYAKSEHLSLAAAAGERDVQVSVEIVNQDVSA